MNTIEQKSVLTRTFAELRSLREQNVGMSAHECMFVLALYDAGEPLKMSEAAHIVGVKRATMTAMADRFELVGYVVREECSTDRRNTKLALTERGVTAVYNALETGWEG